nr:protein NUCLEAR FUSION DEFECTIVE 6, chloroplastic/mitochondrial-like [Ipomoea batatas]
MAASRVLSRLSSRLQPVALKINKSASVSHDASFLKPASQSSVKRFSRISRLPVELSGVETMMPLYSAIASARLKSSLSIESHSWSLVPQGNVFGFIFGINLRSGDVRCFAVVGVIEILSFFPSSYLVL